MSSYFLVGKKFRKWCVRNVLQEVTEIVDKKVINKVRNNGTGNIFFSSLNLRNTKNNLVITDLGDSA